MIRSTQDFSSKDFIRMAVLTADCTMEHIISNTAMVVVDSGTHAGIHVPVEDRFSILSLLAMQPAAQGQFLSMQ